MKDPRLFTIPIFVCLSFHLSSQSKVDRIVEKYQSYKQDNPFEYSYLSTDKNLYYSGGQVKFCVAVLDQYLMPSQLSEIVYLELIHQKSVYRKKFVFKLKGGIKNGRITIPLDIPTGNYQLIAYTHFMRNFPLAEAAHRASIYIQNTLEPPQAVVGTVFPAKMDYEGEEFAIHVGETNSKVLFEFISPFDQPVDAYFVSEGYRSIQFVGKIRLKTGKTDLSIDKALLKGNFQRVILLSEKLDVLSARPYYLHSFGGRVPYGDSGLTRSTQENLLGKIEASNSTAGDSLNLFRRIYKLFYRIPSEVTIDHFGFDELTSTSTLLNYSNYSKREWKEIMTNDNQGQKFDYLPEKNIHLRGTISGDRSKLDGANLSVHFFQDDLDLMAPLDVTGTFDIEIIWTLGNNSIFSSIVDKAGEDISDAYSITFESFDPINYSSHPQQYLNTAWTDSLIAEQKEFNYVLSTFNENGGSGSFVDEIEEVERVVSVDDYRNITSFEDFIREAVINVTVVKRDGARSLNIYHDINGSFGAPQMIILNDLVLKESTPLFDIPIEILESVNVVIDRDHLAKLGATFAGGILRVVTSQPVAVPDEYLNDKFGSVSGFYRTTGKNELANRFNPSSLLHLLTEEGVTSFAEQVELDVKPHLELFQKDGTYHYVYSLKE